MAKKGSVEKISLQTILDHLRDDARNNRDLGDRFERLILSYLQLDPLYLDRFSDIWMWNDFPSKGNVGDVGIDLVARERATGDYCAIQCKFYLPEHTLGKADLDSFFTALGKPLFTTGLIVSTTDKWGKNAEDALAQTKPVTRLSLHDLSESPVDWSTFDAHKPGKLSLAAKKKLRPHQSAALKSVIDGFTQADRGKLIMACGTGKTFTALKIAETVAPAGHVLFLVPSLSLLSQTLREWTAESAHPIHSLAVCSDINIGKRRQKNEDDVGDITLHDLAFPATTNARQLVAQYEALKATARLSPSPGTPGEGRGEGDFERKKSFNAQNHPHPTVPELKMDRARGPETPRLTVVFSTYQSIDAVSKAQKAGLPNFDLIICDEAHRTTGVTLSGEDESGFVKVHDADFLKAKKRLYMTATPRIYGDEAKTKAKEATAELASMDDESLFGKELHRLGFGEAVGKSLLADYKVLVLAVDEKYVSKAFQKELANNAEMKLDDAVKITGCWNGLQKKFEKTTTAVDGDGQAADLQGDVQPMRRAVAFSRKIKDSEAFVEKTAQILAAYKENQPDDANLLELEAKHVDGTFDALHRGALLDWLKADSPMNTCRILSNARCLSEGVDVPALDAVMFLNPRNSVIDVVQSVGRVMRRAEGKRYGYIILPIGIPADMKPEDALKNNDKYKVVWQVLQALRAHDDRFNATINQLELNKNRPDNIQVIGVTGGNESEPGGSSGSGDSKPKVREVQGTFAFPQLEEWKDAIYAKMVLKVGDRAYWETWARDIAAIADKHITRIKALLDDPKSKHAKAFDEFLRGLQHNLNPAVSKEDAIEMLAQHLITKPVFDALFANYAFTQHNPVSVSMQKMLDLLNEQSIDKEAEKLEKFYASVRDRAKGLDNAEARQKVVIELYDEFFRTAFPRMAERLGIVYTPVEVVDFIIHSVQDVLRDEFKSGLGEKDVHIIDPFTGTGTFIVRLLQSGLIPPDKLLHKYQHELHANEIVLLAYYIAAINIEETFHGLHADNTGRAGPSPARSASPTRTDESSADRGEDAPALRETQYIPFNGICLTDTFQLYESAQSQIAGTFPENSARVKRQKASPIRVVIANPPYSVGQGDANANNQNLDYPALDLRVGGTYAARSTATLKNSLYDSYIRAIRWASDRIDQKGIVGFVTNGSFIDGNTTAGVRACLADEFTSVYVFNCRGNARTQGDQRRAEGGSVFGGGTRTPISITLLVRNPAKCAPATIRYHDIGDHLSRDEKLKTIRSFGSVGGIEAAKDWIILEPNEQHDWINQRDPVFESFPSIGDKNEDAGETFFESYSNGMATSRDAWIYNFSSKAVKRNMETMVENFNTEAARLHAAHPDVSRKEMEQIADDFLDSDARKIAWSVNLKRDAVRNVKHALDSKDIRTSLYRPYCKQRLLYDRIFIERPGHTAKYFPNETAVNMAIGVKQRWTGQGQIALIANCIGDLQTDGGWQYFPLYFYEPVNDSEKLGFDKSDGEIIDGYRRRDAITDAILKTFREAYGPKVSKEDIFYYVYGILHSPEYRSRFAADLKKMLPRIPLTTETKDFNAFSKAGRKLAEWHLNYESVEPWPVVEVNQNVPRDGRDDYDYYRVAKMTFARPTPEQKAAGEKWNKTTINFNADITLTKIPLEAYEYVVNGKPAIEWIIERYQVTRDKDSGIVNDPNDWCKEHNQPRYIVDLVKRVVRVSMETINIVKGLPALNERVK